MQVAVRRGENPTGGDWKKALVLVIGWMLILSLARDVWQIRSGFDRISDANARLEAEEAKNEELKKKLQMVLTDEYKEKLIREKLNMQKEGEVIVVFPDGKPNEGETEAEKVENQEENWEKWQRLVSY